MGGAVAWEAARGWPATWGGWVTGPSVPSAPPQVIYMARNPKDLVVAYYQFHRSLRTMSYRGTFQEFCRRFMNDKRECVSPHGRPARPGLVLRPQPPHAGPLPRWG